MPYTKFDFKKYHRELRRGRINHAVISCIVFISFLAMGWMFGEWLVSLTTILEK